MTLTLFLLRHGKSDWSAPYSTDAERPLNRRGRRSAKLMGRFLTATDQQPDLAVTSPARRARDTVALAHRAGSWSCPVIESADLYGGGPSRVFQVLRAIPATSERVLAVGHEPTWSEIVEILTGADIRFPTAALARVELDLHSWETLSAGTGRLYWLIPPRLLTTIRHL